MSNGYVDLLRREPDFRRLYFSELISLSGDWFALVPLLTLLPEITGSGMWGGLVLAADTLIFALMSPYAGTVVDRLDRRQIMVWSNVVSAALILLLLLVRSPLTAWLALVGMGGVAAAKAFYTPAATAAVPNVVGPDDLARANVLVGSAWGTTLAVGAALGGAFAAWLGPQLCFVIDAASFLVATALIVRTRRPFGEARSRHERSSVLVDLRETAEYARRDHRVLSLLAAKLGPGLGNGAIGLFPLFASRVFHVGELGTGLFFSARGFGALAGPLLLRRFISRDEGRLMPGLALSMTLFGGAYMLLGAAPWFALGLVLVAVGHLGGGANWVMSTYGLQAVVPDALRGRVFSADYMIATLGIAASQLVTSLLADRVPTRVLALVLGTVVVAYSAVWWAGTQRLARRTGPAGPAPAAEAGGGMGGEGPAWAPDQAGGD